MLRVIQQTRSLLPGLWAQRWYGLAAAGATAVVTVAIATLIPDKYEASARIFVDTQSILKPLMTGMTVQPNVEQQLAMMGRTLISHPNVERASKEAGLDPGNLSDIEREKLTETLIKEIQFRTAGRENLYSISYRGMSPEKSLKLIESLLAIFVQTKDSAKIRDNEQAMKFIDDQIAIYEKRLLDTESALKDFKVRNLNVMPNLAQDYVARASEAQRDMSAARLELRQAENARNALGRQLADVPATYVATDGSQAAANRPPSEIDLRVDAQRKRLDELLTRFTDEHPDVVVTRRQLDQLVAERARGGAAASLPPGVSLVPNKLYQDLKLQLAQTEASVASLQAKVADAERRMQAARDASASIPKVEAEYAQLNRDYDVNKKNYEQLLARRESAQLSGSLSTSPGVGEYRTIDPPRVTPQPVSPNRVLLMMVALAASIAAGLGVAYLRERMGPTFRAAWTLREETGIEPIGVIALTRGSAALARERQDAWTFGMASMMFLLLMLGIAAFFSLRHLLTWGTGS